MLDLVGLQKEGVEWQGRVEAAMGLYPPIRGGHANELQAELERIAYQDLDAGRVGRLRETKEFRGRPVPHLSTPVIVPSWYKLVRRFKVTNGWKVRQDTGDEKRKKDGE